MHTEARRELGGFARIFLVRVVAKGGVQGECGITLRATLAFVYGVISEFFFYNSN